jgi:hypothetical protein
VCIAFTGSSVPAAPDGNIWLALNAAGWIVVALMVSVLSLVLSTRVGGGRA